MVNKNQNTLIKKITLDNSIILNFNNGEYLTINNDLANIISSIENSNETEIITKIQKYSDFETAQNTLEYLLYNKYINNEYCSKYDTCIDMDEEYSEIVLYLIDENIDIEKIKKECYDIFSKKQLKKIIIYSIYHVYKNISKGLFDYLYINCSNIDISIKIDDFVSLNNEKDMYLDYFNNIYIVGCDDLSRLLNLQNEEIVKNALYEKIIIQPTINRNNFLEMHNYIFDLLILGFKFIFNPIRFYNYMLINSTDEILDDKEILTLFRNILFLLREANINQIPDSLMDWTELISHKGCGTNKSSYLINSNGNLYGCFYEYVSKYKNCNFKCLKNNCITCVLNELCGFNCIFREGKCSLFKIFSLNNILNRNDDTNYLFEKLGEIIENN
ncbi:MAG: hypothetical protein LBU51_04060 [Bacteroidales bacterium]|jgi:hypothetical protein|nr:hypothetical protein [Bacteroidales bacterium]